MTKEELISKHKQYLFKCVTTYYKDPLVIDHAKNQYIWDLDGRQYLDFLGGIVTISVGHSNDKVTAKIKAQIDRVQHCSTLFITEALVALAEKLAQIAPGKLEKCYFTNSGTGCGRESIGPRRAGACGPRAEGHGDVYRLQDNGRRRRVYRGRVKGRRRDAPDYGR